MRAPRSPRRSSWWVWTLQLALKRRSTWTAVLLDVREKGSTLPKRERCCFKLTLRVDISTGYSGLSVKVALLLFPVYIQPPPPPPKTCTLPYKGISGLVLSQFSYA